MAHFNELPKWAIAMLDDLWDLISRDWKLIFMLKKLANHDDRGWAFYGATGVTGRMILERTLARGHRPTLIGRDLKTLNQLAAPHGLRTIRANLDDSKTLADALTGHKLVLNAAGPFRRTAAPIAEAALSTCVDYIDVNGELLVLLQLLNMGERARDRGVALVGGAGFGVAAADGLIAQIVDELESVDTLRISVAADSAFKSKAVTESTLEVLVVLTDENMPGLTGTELTRQVRQVRPDIPVVMMSGHGGAQLAERAAAVGISEVLRKPLQRRDLSEALERTLRSAQPLRRG
jgi:short subunit dehydrogenase-like uncharacterized protein